MGICSVCAFVLWAKHALLSLLPTCLMETVTHQCNTLGMIGKVCDYVRVCCGNGARPLDKLFSSWRAAGWYIPEQTGISQGQEVTVTGPSPAPTEQILEKKLVKTLFLSRFPHEIPWGSSAPLWAEKRLWARKVMGGISTAFVIK